MRRALKEQIIIRSISTLSLILFNLLVFAGDPPAGAIKGRITTADNRPAMDVTVQVKSLRRAVLTAENGQFIIRNLAAGSYELEISLVGHQSIVEQVSVA